MREQRSFGSSPSCTTTIFTCCSLQLGSCDGHVMVMWTLIISWLRSCDSHVTLSTTTTAIQASCESCKQSADSRSCDSHMTLSTTTTAIQASCESCKQSADSRSCDSHVTLSTTTTTTTTAIQALWSHVTLLKFMILHNHCLRTLHWAT